jgi:hypothetical protein
MELLLRVRPTFHRAAPLLRKVPCPTTICFHPTCVIVGRLEPRASQPIGPPPPSLPLSCTRAGPPLPLFPLATSVEGTKSSTTATSMPRKISASSALNGRPSTPPLPFVLLEPLEHHPLTGIWTKHRRHRH